MDATTFAYTISTDIVEGTYYDVAVQAGNEVGLNELSDSVRIVAAVAPDAPQGL